MTLWHAATPPTAATVRRQAPAAHPGRLRDASGTVVGIDLGGRVFHRAPAATA
ncbi:hypothetical protein ACIPPS_06390 [Streptomyces sp. NPDC090127]|uniref:hypothetical protein n=1 Tax=Streptomyces sp. NPDC090127 TaxID=3365953 RepID=UPI003822F995